MRGLAWYNFRNLDDVINPDIAADPNKMIEVNYYLDCVKTRDKDAVHKIFERYRLIDLKSPKDKDARMKLVAAELDKLEPEEKTRPMNKTELQDALDEKGIDYKEENTKAELLEMLEGK